MGVLAIASLASCSDDKVTGISPSANGEEITYSVVTNKATRSTLYSNNAKPESFYVWAATTDDGTAYIEGDKVTTTDQGVTYTDATNTHYWPSGSLDFYATNYASANLDVTSSTSRPAISAYTVATAVADQEDLLYAIAVNQSSGTVNLNFRHALAQIVFQAKNENAQLYVKITGVGVHGVYDTGTFTFPEEATVEQQTSTTYASSLTVGIWNPDDKSKNADYSIELSSAVTLEGKTATTDLTSGETALLLLPQEIDLAENYHHENNAYLTLDCAIYNIAGTTYDEDNDLQLYTGTVYFPLAIFWEAGKKYTYLFDFGGSDSDNHTGEDDDDNPILTPITYSVTVDDFVETDVVEEDVYTVRDLNGHEAVDLGLSVLWATCNVGASSETDYGDYYAFGEIATKEEYSPSNCTWYGKEVDEETIKGNPLYDAATANWGGTWRLPTEKEIEELVDTDNCTWTWTTETDSNGNTVNGMVVTSKINGNSIFLPAAGCYENTDLESVGTNGDYGSCSPDLNDTMLAYYFNFNKSSYSAINHWGRNTGISVRPVSK